MNIDDEFVFFYNKCLKIMFKMVFK